MQDVINGDLGKNDRKQTETSNNGTPKVNDDKANEDRKIFVGGLTWEIQLKHLKEYFEKFGDLESVNLRFSPQTGMSQCFGVIVFNEASSAKEVLAGGVHAINDKRVDVKKIQFRY